MRLAALMLAAALGLWAFGPYEPSDLTTDFDARRIGADVDLYLAAEEARFTDIKPGLQKQVIWAHADRRKTPVSLIYVHGYSASLQEIRPVPDEVAAALGANLVFTRLTGHARGGAAMAGAQVADWMRDVAEALAVARRIGERTVVLSVSTGGTLMAAAATQEVLAEGVAGIVFISPNFGIQSAYEPLLTLPAVRWWLPPLAGRERHWRGQNALHDRYWTTRYPSVSVLPMAALVQATRRLDFSETAVPAFFIYSPADAVVRAEETDRVVAKWGGPTRVLQPVAGPGIDPNMHVLAGDILSPANTTSVISDIVSWISKLPDHR
jgi:alpha-beta hydrolase superfamily lysophospholipase